ncbi:hypothetical protein EON64_17200, partial [archaeon]
MQVREPHSAQPLVCSPSTPLSSLSFSAPRIKLLAYTLVPQDRLQGARERRGQREEDKKKGMASERQRVRQEREAEQQHRRVVLLAFQEDRERKKGAGGAYYEAEAEG